MTTARAFAATAFLTALAGVAGSVPAAAVLGIPDSSPAATLLVPYAETGIDRGTHPHDSILVVQSVAGFQLTIHWTAWSLDGLELESLSGSTVLAPAGAWSIALRDHIGANASPGDLAAMEDGDFYRLFLTVDVVEEETTLNPFSPLYPFSGLDAIEGSIYYTRLGEGSSNGLPMVALEYAGPDVDEGLRGFYAGNSDHGLREGIDGRARLCATTLTEVPEAEGCTGLFDGTIHRIHARAFLSEPLAGETRLVVFAWNTTRRTEGGPSVVCDANPFLECESEYLLRRYEESGELVEERTIRLDRVVTVVTFDEGAIGGLVTIRDIPDPDLSLQIYAFAFNSAKPPGTGQNWDAIFEAVVVP